MVGGDFGLADVGVGMARAKRGDTLPQMATKAAEVRLSTDFQISLIAGDRRGRPR
jgi:hypothetical protein